MSELTLKNLTFRYKNTKLQLTRYSWIATRFALT